MEEGESEEETEDEDDEEEDDDDEGKDCRPRPAEITKYLVIINIHHHLLYYHLSITTPSLSTPPFP